MTVILAETILILLAVATIVGYALPASKDNNHD